MLAARAIDERIACGERYFGAEAERLARLCHAMAERFARGGRLLACGATPAAVSDARHVAVEFVHPVIVGKRALPALAVACEDVITMAREGDIVMAFGAEPPPVPCLAVSFQDVPTDDPFIAQEVVETAYHVLWELVHVFFEHRGLLSERTERAQHDGGASAFLYPFLDERESDLDAVLADVAGSVRAKAAEAGALRAQTLEENAIVLQEAADTVRGAGKVLALGNGGSATDAMDAVADLRPRPAIDLTADSPILTAVANDIGVEAMFARQVIAYGEPGDALLSFSTSGNSANVIAALAQARRHHLATVALVGYDGGRIAGEGLADHVIVTRSEHIPRIQEAQASAWHVLRELVEDP